ncbi:galactosyltransferase-related protein [Rhodococcus sp. G-MC3]|uniref:glycosyltransferase family 2 protein n=1 Tax=Rhodococcus sp. G-MC3 TaxID=3046209 RepID=UPI0024BAF70D|nr:galactosyltransferase-related protein [Rhodococcus sp. G-MC3]MDJ0392871.1 galactosyltransferase-related protein [Rhodococcus sp. G-MC3]
MNIAVVTVVAGRHDHLRAQLRGLAESSVTPAHHVVVSMGDKDIAGIVDASPNDATVVELGAVSHLPLSAARNQGARAAVSSGADLIVFLDVDCIPGTDMLGRYASAAAETDNHRTLLCGPVTYLPPRDVDWTAAELMENTDPHPARPAPPPGLVIDGTDYDLFWSLSFALTPTTWNHIGGFHEEYTGYGGEDTDFAATARAAGVGLRWVGGADAYHQHHPVSSPPVERLDDIVRNSAVFFRRWNRWPMEGWLAEFERAEMIERSRDGRIRVVR